MIVWSSMRQSSSAGVFVLQFVLQFVLVHSFVVAPFFALVAVSLQEQNAFRTMLESSGASPLANNSKIEKETSQTHQRHCHRCRLCPGAYSV